MFAGLNSLSNFDKHRVVQAAFSGVLEPAQDDFDVISSDDSAFVEFETPLGQRLEDGTEVVRLRIVTSDPNAKVQVKATIPIAVAFGEPGILIDGLAPLYEAVRDLIKSYTGAFAAAHAAAA